MRTTDLFPCCRLFAVQVAVLLWAAVAFSFHPAESSAAEAKPLAKGDRIVFLGDSITQAGVRPDGFVTLVAQAIKEQHPDLGVEVIGAGISGHKVPDCQKRLDRDVISKKPTIVMIYIGINDVWHSQSGRGTSKEDYEKGLHDLIKRSTDAGARVILCTPSVIGEKTDGSNKLDTMLDEYCGISRQVAKATGTQMLDLRKKFLAHLKQHNPDNKERGVLTGDGVHLNKEGNQFVADCMLEALGEGNKSAASAGKILRHVVLFKFKDGTSPEKIKEIEDAFAALPGKIDAIQDFEWGTDNSPEGKAQGFTHCYLVTFANEQGRDAYLPHPAHEAFKKIVGPHLDKVLVVDYWAED